MPAIGASVPSSACCVASSAARYEPRDRVKAVETRRAEDGTVASATRSAREEGRSSGGAPEPCPRAAPVGASRRDTREACRSACRARSGSRRQTPGTGGRLGGWPPHAEGTHATGAGRRHTEGVEISEVERGELERVRLVVDVCQNSRAVRPWCVRVEGANPRTCCNAGGGYSASSDSQYRARLPHQDRQIGILLRIGGSTGPQSRPRQARQRTARRGAVDRGRGAASPGNARGCVRLSSPASRATYRIRPGSDR